MVPDYTLTILVPTYRRADLLRVCLQSIVDSRLKILEVVVGDDGGDDATKQVCEDFTFYLPIKYLPPKPNAKGSLSSNLGRLIQAAEGEWVLLLHDDDFLIGDHSIYPGEFANQFDFYFTDHYNTDEQGILNEEKSLWASTKYGRINLKEGKQEDVFDLAINERVCLDGFYIKTKYVKNILPDESLGPVADFFWMFYLLNCGVRVGYSSKRTFAYRTTEAGLTASGIDFDSLIKGFKKIRVSFPSYKHSIDNRISYYSWYAVNKCLRENERKKALLYLRNINFRYKHSVRCQFLMIVQLILLVLPTSLSKKLHNKL